MPKAFEDCVKNGGRVRTKKLKNDRYIRICYDKKGNSFPGEVMITKKKKQDKATETKQIKDSKKLVESLLELQTHFNDNYHE